MIMYSTVVPKYTFGADLIKIDQIILMMWLKFIKYYVFNLCIVMKYVFGTFLGNTLYTKSWRAIGIF